MKTPSLILACVIVSAGCHTIRSVQADRVTARPPQRLWVTFADRGTVVFEQPQMNGDTLTGLVYGEPEQIPLSAATRILAREPAPARTALLAAATGVVLLGAVMYLENRPDVGNAQYCGNQFGAHPQPFTSCCPATDSVPC
jgi:hypothetical protein